MKINNLRPIPVSWCFVQDTTEMPEIIVYAMEGRSHEQKQALVRDITDACVKHLETPSEAVVIQFVECPPSSKSKGGVLFSDMTQDDVRRIFGPRE